MSYSTVTSKGQTTIPKEIRDAMNAPAGTQLFWSRSGSGAFIVRPKNRSILEFAGMLKSPLNRPVTIEEMNPWR